jgi:hypothetical protein
LYRLWDPPGKLKKGVKGRPAEVYYIGTRTGRCAVCGDTTDMMLVFRDAEGNVKRAHFCPSCYKQGTLDEY